MRDTLKHFHQLKSKKRWVETCVRSLVVIVVHCLLFIVCRLLERELKSITDQESSEELLKVNVSIFHPLHTLLVH